MTDTRMVAALRREARRQGYLLRKCRQRSLWVLLDDTPKNRRGYLTAQIAIEQGKAQSLRGIEECLRLNNLRAEAFYQGLEIVAGYDGGYALVNDYRTIYLSSIDHLDDFLTEDEHCVRCYGEHEDDHDEGRHTADCGWGFVFGYLVCPSCLTNVESRVLSAKH